MYKVVILVLLLFAISAEIASLQLKCTYKMLEFDLNGSIYGCKPSVFVDSNNNATISPGSGVHESGKGKNDILGLYIYNQYINVIPRNVKELFPNIKCLHFNLNEISTLTNNDIISIPKMVYLNLDYNHITSLDSHLFSGLEYLQYVSLAHNQIKQVGYEVGLPTTVTYINIENNLCINIAYAEGAERITRLKFHLMVRCSLTPNVHTLETNAIVTSRKLEDLKRINLEILGRIAELESIN